MTHEKFLVVPYVYDCSCARTVVAAVFTCPILSQSSTIPVRPCAGRSSGGGGK
eukprot:SAG25_NODE_3075_length_1229_cov_1.099912_1_plen_52_part_10